MKTVYCINPETKQLLGLADVELLNENTTTVEPPTHNVNNGESVFWNGSSWDIKIVDRGLFWISNRSKREELLAETDWTQAADSPLSPEVQAEVKAYRQALRDITKQDPNNLVWPVNPLAK